MHTWCTPCEQWSHGAHPNNEHLVHTWCTHGAHLVNSYPGAHLVQWCTLGERLTLLSHLNPSITISIPLSILPLSPCLSPTDSISILLFILSLSPHLFHYLFYLYLYIYPSIHSISISTSITLVSIHSISPSPYLSLYLFYLYLHIYIPLSILFYQHIYPYMSDIFHSIGVVEEFQR